MTDKEAEVRATVEEMLDKFFADMNFVPAQDHIQTRVEMIRSEVQRQYDLAYEAGMIDKKPTVTAEWNQKTKEVDVHVNWPIDVLVFRFVYSNNPENSAIDALPENP